MLHADGENVKKPRSSSTVDNRLASTSYDNDVASGSAKDDDNDDDDDDDAVQGPGDFLDSRDEENYLNRGNGSGTSRKRRGTMQMCYIGCRLAQLRSFSLCLLFCMMLLGVFYLNSEHQSGHNYLAVKRESRGKFRKLFLLYCAPQLCTIIHAQSYEQFLNVDRRLWV